MWRCFLLNIYIATDIALAYMVSKHCSVFHQEIWPTMQTVFTETSHKTSIVETTPRFHGGWFVYLHKANHLLPPLWQVQTHHQLNWSILVPIRRQSPRHFVYTAVVSRAEQLYPHQWARLDSYWYNCCPSIFKGQRWLPNYFRWSLQRNRGGLVSLVTSPRPKGSLVKCNQR